MVPLVDFNKDDLVNRFYGGNAGRKLAVRHEGGIWMLKFPEPTAGMRGKRLPSYTTSPLSEYLGSQIYGILGLPVHETILGFRDGKVVCACRDFTSPSLRLSDFHDVKNALADETDASFERRPSDGSSIYLSDVLNTISVSPYISKVEGVVERFWDMFVTDAFIGNADRNNTNWGFLVSEDGSMSLAPVYDNGNSFFNKRRASADEERMGRDDLLEQDAIGGVQTCYLRDDGKQLNPLKYISSCQDELCCDAVVRFMDSLDMAAIDALIDSIPDETLNMTVLPGEVAEFHKKCLHRRVEEVFQPAKEIILGRRMPGFDQEPNRVASELISHAEAAHRLRAGRGDGSRVETHSKE